MQTWEEAYNEIKVILDEYSEKESRLRGLKKKIAANKAGFTDTAEYTQIMARQLGEIISEKISEVTDPSGKEMIFKALLRDQYENINSILKQVQLSIDEDLGIHLNPIKPEFPTDRVNKAAHSLEDPTVPLETIKRRGRSTAENITNSFHDDYIKTNADYRSKAGLNTYIQRSDTSKCCDWCASLIGKYHYPDDIPDDIFRRHDNCTCKVEYICDKGRQNVHTKKWIRENEKSRRIEYVQSVKKPVKRTKEQAKSLEKHLLDKSQKSDIISVEEKLKMIGFSSIDPSFYKNVNIDMQSAITDQLTLLEERFKAISSSNKPTISADLKGGSTACVRSELNNPENQNLKLSSRQFKNRKRHIADRRKDVEDFFCMPCNTDDETLSKYVVTHEYGHMLENSIAAQDMKGTINTFPRLAERYREQIEKIARTIDTDYDNNKSNYLSRYVKEEVSYGYKDVEFFAECFANSQLGQPNVLGQAMLQWLEKRGFDVL